MSQPARGALLLAEVNGAFAERNANWVAEQQRKALEWSRTAIHSLRRAIQAFTAIRKNFGELIIILSPTPAYRDEFFDAHMRAIDDERSTSTLWGSAEELYKRDSLREVERQFIQELEKVLFGTAKDDHRWLIVEGRYIAVLVSSLRDALSDTQTDEGITLLAMINQKEESLRLDRETRWASWCTDVVAGIRREVARQAALNKGPIAPIVMQLYRDWNPSDETRQDKIWALERLLGFNLRLVDGYYDGCRPLRGTYLYFDPTASIQLKKSA